MNAVNAVFAEKGIVLPLASGQTVTEESRLLDGIAAQKSIFGDQIDAMRAAAPENQKNIQDDLSAYCFGDFYTRKFLPRADSTSLAPTRKSSAECFPEVRETVCTSPSPLRTKETCSCSMSLLTTWT